uniref:Si:dkey-156n14.3 n=1 Tax=Erpetoichthys calabaricus TaxID=27687 RepID=A0A8C4TK08_ERPCA
MEMQGLFAAQNTQHQQHGVSCREKLSRTARDASRPAENEADLFHRGPLGKQSVEPLFRPLTQHGCSGLFSTRGSCSSGSAAVQTYAAIGLRNVNALPLPNGKGREEKEGELKADFDNDDTGIQLAFPVLLVEDGHTQSQQLLRQLQDGAPLPSAQIRESAVALTPIAKDNEEFYVVVNVVQEGDRSYRKEAGRGIPKVKDPVAMHDVSKDVTEAPIAEINSESEAVDYRRGLGSVTTSTCQSSSSEGSRDTAVQGPPFKHRAGCFVFASDSVDSDLTASSQPSPLPDDSSSSRSQLEIPPDFQQTTSRCRGTNSALVEPAQNGNQLYNTFMENSPDTGMPDYPSPQTGDTFSGTIAINNQNLVLTIENGVLTLSASPDGGVHILQQHHQLKECAQIKDQLLLKNERHPGDRDTNIKVGEQRKNNECGDSAPSGHDSNPNVNGDSAFSDSIATKASSKEVPDGTLFCALSESDMICAEAKEDLHSSFVLTENEELQMATMSKKGVVVLYHCTQPNCSLAFDTKHKLKLHLLSHTEDKRPFKCTVEGCSWSFTTSYKLKRHLQSHDKTRPFTCDWDSCGRKFTTIYNLKAHVKAHEQESNFVCDVCSERFRTSTKLTIHHRSHFEPERPYKCEFPGCEKTFITFSSLHSHSRAHYRETDQFSCTFPGCDKRYDKACRLKIHLRSHTGERPFMCDFEACGWSFTSMSKLLRHKRKHDDDRRFTCPEEGCGKSFTRAEHLKGHSITHLGTKPFECNVDGCFAKFSARSSLYIHSKKHLQDVESLKTNCPIASCNKQFISKSSMKSHMVKHHNLGPDLLNQLEINSLTPSNELTQGDLANIDITSLFSSVPGSASAITMDMSLVNSGILTIDAASVGATLGGSISVSGNTLTQTVDPLILAAGPDISHALDNTLALGTSSTVLQPSTLNLDDVPTVNAEALGSLAALSVRTANQDPLHGLTSNNTLAIDTATLTPSNNLGVSHVPELLTPTKAERNLLPSADVVGQQDNSKVVTQFVFSNPTGSFSAQKDIDLNSVANCSFLERGGSARTDYRAFQLAKKKKKQKVSGTSQGAPLSSQKKAKTSKGNSTPVATVNSSGQFGVGVVSPNTGLTIRDPATGAQFVQIQLLQDDPSGDGDLGFQLSSQSSGSHAQLTVDLPVNILQEPPASNEDDAGSDNSQFTGSTINLQDLE